MYCKHCYRDAGAKVDEELNTEEGKALLGEIAKAGFKIMIFSGGEPFMREDIVELVQHATSLGLRPVFGTNGTMIDDVMAKRLKQAGTMGVGISLDSVTAEKHDKLRGFPGAWESALEGMRNCKNNDLSFQIHTTLMDWNYDEIEELTDLAVEMGAVAHHIFFLVPTGRAVTIEEESLRAEQYESVLKRIMSKQKEVDIELKPTCAPQFMRIAKEMGVTTRFQRGCLAGTSYCIISPKGRVQPCAYLDMEVGNIRKTPFSEIWKNSEIFNTLRTLEYTGGCGNCKYKVACGGCRARAAFYNDGDYMAEEPWCLYHGRKGLATDESVG